MPSAGKHLWKDNIERVQGVMKGIVCSPLDLEKVVQAELELYGTHRFKKVCSWYRNESQVKIELLLPMEAKAHGSRLFDYRKNNNKCSWTQCLLPQDIKESPTMRRH